MALDPLATVEDAIARLGRELTPEQAARVTALLDDASSVIRIYTGRIFGEADVTLTLPVRLGVVTLSDDVSGVVSVETLDGVAVAYDWDGRRRVYVGTPWQFDVEPLSTSTSLRITYTRTDPVSDTGLALLRAVACQVAMRAFGRDATDSGMQQESISGYSYTVGAAAAAGAVGLLPDERRALDRFRRIGNTAWLAPR